MKTIKLFTFIFLLIPALMLISSCTDDQVAIEDFSSLQTIKSDIILGDNSRAMYSHKISYSNGKAIFYRSIVGTFLENAPMERYEILINNKKELPNLILKGNVWFIPNSGKQPVKLSMDESRLKTITSRTADIDDEVCFCETPGTGTNPNWCNHYYEGQCTPPAPGDGCAECDVEFCIDTKCFAETRGGGIFILADTVICIDENPNVIFGGRTKISLHRSNDTLYFKRIYINDTDVFGQCLFNATGISAANGFGSNTWHIPFDKNIQASSAADASKSCKSDPNDACNIDCDQEQQENGCFRCKCPPPGTGDCDYLDEIDNPVSNGVFVTAIHIVEIFD